MERPEIRYEPVKLGMIGCGKYAQGLAYVCKASPKIDLALCWDPIPAASEHFEMEYGCKAVRTIEELLEDDSILGVIIVSPNDAHYPNTAAAASAGKHVFVDKPIAHSIDDAKKMISICEQHGVMLAVGHNQRRLPGHRKIKELIENGEIGIPITAEANFSHSGGMGLTPDAWRASRERCPGLPLMQLGVHHCDTLQYLLGEITEVCSFMKHLAIPVDNDDATVTILRFARGTLGYLGSNYATPNIYYLDVHGTEGNAFCEHGRHVAFRKAGTEKPIIIEVDPVDTQLEELEEFADCIRTGAKYEITGEDGLRALAIVHAAFASAQKGTPVAIKDIIGS